jgi:NitT/TauT family transport system permease protein
VQPPLTRGEGGAPRAGGEAVVDDAARARPRPSEAAAPAARKTAGQTETFLRWVPVLLVIAGLAAWELSVQVGLVSRLFYPPPSAIARALARLVQTGALPAHLAASFSRILLGFCLGGGIALVLGLCMGWSHRLRLVLDPLVAAAHPVPRIAILPLILLFFGIGETARLVVIAISAFFPLLINTTAGVRQLDGIHFEVARNFGARPHQVFAWVVLPGTLPSVLTGARLSFVGALRTTLTIELITSDRGLGHLIWFAWETFRTEELYATLIVIAVLGFGTNFLLERMALLLMPWRPARGR